MEGGKTGGHDRARDTQHTPQRSHVVAEADAASNVRLVELDGEHKRALHRVLDGERGRAWGEVDGLRDLVPHHIQGDPVPAATHNAQHNTYARQSLARNSPCEGQRQGIPSLGKHIQRDVHGDGVFEQGRLAANNGAACQCLALDDVHEVRLQQVDNLLEQAVVLSGVRVESLDEGLAGVAHDLCARAHRSDLWPDTHSHTQSASPGDVVALWQLAPGVPSRRYRHPGPWTTGRQIPPRWHASRPPATRWRR